MTGDPRSTDEAPAAVRFRVREPVGEPDGLLVLHHGRATDENDLFPLLDALQARTAITPPRARCSAASRRAL